MMQTLLELIKSSGNELFGKFKNLTSLSAGRHTIPKALFSGISNSLLFIAQGNIRYLGFCFNQIVTCWFTRCI